MAEHLNQDEVRAQNIAAMGARLGALYTDLYKEILWLHVVWRQYRVLFGTSQPRFELLQKAARSFFGMLDDTLWESVLLHICRLTDPPVVGRRSSKQTLTLLRLAGAIPEPEFAKRVRSLVGRARTTAKFARDERDRRIAHRDLELVQSENARPLERGSRASVEGVLALFRDIVDAMEGHYFSREKTTFDYVSPPNDAEALLYQLRLARMIQDDWEARFMAGESRPDDFKRPPEI
jgi:hypothetical protein